jgi:hypothetical protein
MSTDDCSADDGETHGFRKGINDVFNHFSTASFEGIVKGIVTGVVLGGGITSII